MGVRAFFFLPVFVAALTRADEFHSVTNTRCPSALSHFASRPSWVVFPEPSMPSTTKSFPGYSCGFVRLFNMALSTYLESEGLADETFERCGVTCGSPHLQLSIARRSKLKQTIVTSIVQLDCRHGLLVAAVEALRQTQDRGK